MTTETAAKIVKGKKKIIMGAKLKEASYYKKLKEKVVRCELCPRFCVLNIGQWGNCNARRNIDGRLYSMVYGRPVSLAIDPIEKKPLFHFLPGQKALSIATAGCNFHCQSCQNWSISQSKPDNIPYLGLSPKAIINKVKASKLSMISYTYNEPTVFYEYMVDIAKLAKERGIKNTAVTNGFINQEPLIELCKLLDSANIDFKGPNRLYKKFTGGWRRPVEDSVKLMHEKGVWIEVTNLIIPGHNGKEKDIKEIILWVKKNLGVDVPLHFSAFYPSYMMLDVPAAKSEIIIKARKLAIKTGLNYVYAGNIPDEEGLTTFCPQCKKPVILRSGFSMVANKLIKGKCPYCNEKIAGVWK